MFFMLLHRLILLIILCLLPLSQAHSQSGSLIGKMQALEDSLVEIKTVYSRALNRNGHLGVASFERHGAGIIIDPAGIIVTNTHIVINAPHIFVALSNGKVYEATLLFSSDADFSFIKINVPSPLKAVEWAESSQAQLGQEIVAIGNSELNYQSILGGQITSLIESKSTGRIEMLELNLSLYKGDSGGPIFDKQGRLLGLIMAKQKATDRNSYAIASDKIRLEYLNYR